MPKGIIHYTTEWGAGASCALLLWGPLTLRTGLPTLLENAVIASQKSLEALHTLLAGTSIDAGRHVSRSNAQHQKCYQSFENVHLACFSLTQPSQESRKTSMLMHNSNYH